MLSAVQSLPLRQRSVIVQRELEGRSYDEIADRLGVTNGAVRQLLNRARTSLRAGLAALATPVASFSRLASSMSDAPAAGRVAELCGSGGPAVAAKLCATAALSGALVGGIQPADVTPRGEKRGRDAGSVAQSRPVNLPSREPASKPAGGTSSAGVAAARPGDRNASTPLADHPRARVQEDDAGRRQEGRPDEPSSRPHGDRGGAREGRDEPRERMQVGGDSRPAMHETRSGDAPGGGGRHGGEMYATSDGSPTEPTEGAPDAGVGESPGP